MKRLKALIALTTLIAPTSLGWNASLHADDLGSNNGTRVITVRKADGTIVKRTVPKTATVTQSKASLPRPTRKPSSEVTQASYQAGMEEVVHEGEMIHEGVIHEHGAGGCTTCGSPSGSGCGCGSSCDAGVGCDLGCCDQCLQPNRLCICLPGHGWAHMEYMMGWTSPMNIPPLVITGTDPDAVFVGDPNTRVLLGEGNTTGRDTMLSDRRAGGRLRFGWSLANFPGYGIDAEYFSLGNATDSFRATGTATNPIALPFQEVNPNLLQTLYDNDPNATSESSKTVDRATFHARSRLDGGAVHFSKLFCCSNGCRPSFFFCDSVPTQSRWEGFVGYRYMQLKESLEGEYGALIPTTAPLTLAANDYFGTTNQFNGADFGVRLQRKRGYWSSDLLLRMAMGNNRETVTIRGNSSVTTPNGATTRTVFSSATTGIYAGPSNVGVREQDVFAIIPELGATVGYQLTQRIRLTAGYTFIYWSRVVRPGEQIDREINSLNNGFLTAPAAALNPRISPDKPQFEFKETDYVVQGLNLGGEYRW